ncbi:Peroxidasin [Gryllus bimaculatus]|nr:Peroxidasin [Gryllus bimaculatus]
MCVERSHRKYILRWSAARLDITLGFTRQPQDVVAVRSRALLLECEVSSTVEYNVTWTHDDRPLQLTSDSRRQLLANGSLYFKKVQFKRAGAHDTSDQGEYRCVARNAVGALVSRPAQLRVATANPGMAGEHCARGD